MQGLGGGAGRALRPRPGDPLEAILRGRSDGAEGSLLFCSSRVFGRDQDVKESSETGRISHKGTKALNGVGTQGLGGQSRLITMIASIEVSPGRSRRIKANQGESRWIKVDQGGSRWIKVIRLRQGYGAIGKMMPDSLD